MLTGGGLLVKAMAAQGVERAFCVAGESYLPVLDGILDFPEIAVVTCRQESGVTFMAEAYANLTGQVGVAMVTRGPGACNASIGVHSAKQSSTPLVMLVGLVSTADRDREAFQEFDLPQMFASHAKWAAVIDKTERIPEYIARAFHVAKSGRPGPVVLGLPEDILFAQASEIPVHAIPAATTKPCDSGLGRVRDMLQQAGRPLVLAGGGGWSDEDCAELLSFSSATHLPLVSSFRRQDLCDHSHANYIGELGTGPNPDLIARVKAADVILVLGARLSEITTQGYTLFDPDQKIIHVYPDASVFGLPYVPALAIQAHPSQILSSLAALAPWLDGRRWAGWRDEGRKAYLDWTALPEARVHNWRGADMGQVFRQLRDLLPRDAVVTTDAGNFSGWCQRYLRYGRPGRLLAPLSGAMGYAIPSAVAASIAQPEKLVVGVCGDGGFMMTLQELATAMHHGAKPVIIVCNNGLYGTIRMHQEREFPGRSSATDLTNPDFVMLGRSFGAYAARVEHEDQFEPIWREALASGGPAVIEIVMDPRQISTTAKI